MKKGKGVMIATIGFICFILTYVMIMQFKTVEETNITQIENMRESELSESLANWKEKYETANTKLEDVNEKLSSYREKRESNQEASELLNKELQQARAIAGITDVKGDGVVITYRDDDESYLGKIDSSKLIELVNELRVAGAEAISINDQRIINMTDIIDIEVDGTSFVLVNKKRVTSPYVIKAIGNQKDLENTLTTKKIGFAERNTNATVEKQNGIKILKYTSEIKIKYASVVEGGK